MKILHTSDLHLREYEDDRWKTLLKLLEIGKQNNIEILAISGDLFDNNLIAEELRPKLRSIFSQNKFKIVIIPGNHDKDSYKSGKYFGDDIALISQIT